jgi:hypothetical protein
MANTHGMPWPKDGTWPHQCECCKDKGTLGNTADGFRFCGCPTGRAAAKDPEKVKAMEASNQERLTVAERCSK